MVTARISRGERAGDAGGRRPGRRGALALATIDVVFVARQVIAPVYLADAAVEVVLAVWWAAARSRRP